MWRLFKLIFTLTVLLGGMLAGVYFVNANPAVVNVQFPILGRESGPAPLGITLLAAGAVGMALAMVLAFVVSIGMTLHAQRLKREIRALKREVDALRNLPLLDDEFVGGDDDESDEDFDDDSTAIDVPAGPVRGGSTVAHDLGDEEDSVVEDSVDDAGEPAAVMSDDGDDEDDENGEDDDDDDDPSSTRVSGGTRKIDSP